MLAYRHQFHAGNFADVFKHSLLARLLLALERKDKPFFYLDTHAGTGRYDLEHPWARKNAEFEDGIARVLRHGDFPQLIKPYIDAVRAENPEGGLRYYPGSARIARRLLRAGDRAVLSELNKKDCAELARLFARDRQVSVRLMDGYQALKAYLPPKERRGLVLVDSSFDRAKEFARLVEALRDAYRRWATGVYALWFPLMDPAAMRAFVRDLAASGVRRLLWLEFRLKKHEAGKLAGCGMLVVNPPYGFAEDAAPILGWLKQSLGGTAQARELVGE
ncbi:MAG TPA: 23S rRNA (adenine(2030)-N(6))-methyltransferase RlmJ [Burkholderiales bacterium]|nr:23S rRNA (adenine(2030)-N(6))-methyltransferase RlmJ [Burkholderiales bacterium]